MLRHARSHLNQHPHQWLVLVRVVCVMPVVVVFIVTTVITVISCYKGSDEGRVHL